MNLDSGFVRRVPLQGGKEAELYVVGREDPEARVAREAVEELIAAAAYETRHTRRLSYAAAIMARLELGDIVRERVAHVLVTEDLDELDRSLLRGLLEELDESEGEQ